MTTRTTLVTTALALWLLAGGLAGCGAGGGSDLLAGAGDETPEPFAPAPAPAAYADDGCATCHGVDGSGAAGPDIRCSSYEFLDVYVRTSPTSHAGGAFPSLTDQDLTDMVAFLRTAECPGTPGTEPPPSGEVPPSHTEAEGDANVLHHPDYERNLATCAACHGANLEGSASAPSCASCHGNSGDDFDIDDDDDGDDDEHDGDDEDDGHGDGDEGEGDDDSHDDDSQDD